MLGEITDDHSAETAAAPLERKRRICHRCFVIDRIIHPFSSHFQSLFSTFPHPFSVLDHLNQHKMIWSVNLIPLGIVLFIVGISGNFYHHYLLSKLRKDGVKLYCIPQGGLFGCVVCPHYFFELIEFLGVAFICQTLFAFCVVSMMFFSLVGRSISTKSWYMKKFEDFPGHRKALIPFLM